jgi:hypothetical protein
MEQTGRGNCCCGGDARGTARAVSFNAALTVRAASRALSAAMLAGRLAVLRPKLGLVDQLLHLRLELADMTSSPQASTLLLQSRAELPQLLVHDDVDALLPLLQVRGREHTCIP